MRLPSLLVAILVGVFYLVVPLLILFFVRNEKKLKTVLLILVGIFCFVLFVGVFGKVDITAERVYIGFDFSGKWCSKTINFQFNTTKLDRLINLVMLMPLGEAVCIFSKRKNIKIGFLIALIVGLGTGLLIETLQYVLPVSRSVQLSDVVYNMISAAIGYLFVSVVFYLVKLVRYLVQRCK